MRASKLRALLLDHGVPVDDWGKGKAKTLQQLSEELVDGECSLVLTENKVHRVVEACAINVFGMFDSARHCLVEVKQVFLDGRERSRKLSTSLGEKLKPGEDPDRAVLRALEEELHVGVPGKIVRLARERESPRASDSYPGLLTEYIFHRFDVDLCKEDLKREGYEIPELDKIVYYAWK